MQVLPAPVKKAEHYEISSYGTLASFAGLLGETEVAGLLKQTVGEEKEADTTLLSIAESSINPEAAGEVSEKDEDTVSSTNARNNGRPKVTMQQPKA